MNRATCGASLPRAAPLLWEGRDAGVEAMHAAERATDTTDYLDLCQRHRADAEKLFRMTGTATAELEVQLAQVELDTCERQRALQPIGDLLASRAALREQWECAAEIELMLREAQSKRDEEDALLEGGSLELEHNSMVLMVETLRGLGSTTAELECTSRRREEDPRWEQEYVLLKDAAQLVGRTQLTVRRVFAADSPKDDRGRVLISTRLLRKHFLS
jgi:hypothetical protein